MVGRHVASRGVDRMPGRWILPRARSLVRVTVALVDLAGPGLRFTGQGHGRAASHYHLGAASDGPITEQLTLANLSLQIAEMRNGSVLMTSRLQGKMGRPPYQPFPDNTTWPGDQG